MFSQVQPAKKSYFFGKGYRDLINTINGAWERNFSSIGKYKDNISIARMDSNKVFALKLILNVLAMISVIICGSAIMIAISLANIVVLLSFMLIVYIGFSAIWITDRIYLTRKKIFAACHECKEKSLIPTYLCPKCGTKHTNLTPGVYGILHRTCLGDNPTKSCGQVLPTTFFNGRRHLEASCPNCESPLADRETVPICIPIVGGRSVGKTAFITAFSKSFIEQVAPAKGWEIDLYNEDKSNIYNEIVKDYETGSTRMTDRPQDVHKASSVSFSFFVKGNQFKPERLVHVYDIAGEVFTDNCENEIQKQYEYCQGIVFIIDPFSIPSLRFKYEKQLAPEDLAGIGKADISGIVDSFLNKLREVTGLSDSKMSKVPLAVVINKIDSADLMNQIGDEAVKNKMTDLPEHFNNYQDTQDFLCRAFLKENGMESFLNNIDIKFKANRFFSCSAIGHTRDHGEYRPQGVLAPMEWLFRNADVKMAQSWNDTQFSKTVKVLNLEGQQ